MFDDGKKKKKRKMFAVGGKQPKETSKEKEKDKEKKTKHKREKSVPTGVTVLSTTSTPSPPVPTLGVDSPGAVVEGTTFVKNFAKTLQNHFWLIVTTPMT